VEILWRHSRVISGEPVNTNSAATGTPATRWWAAPARCGSCAPQGQKDKQNGTVLRVTRTFEAEYGWWATAACLSYPRGRPRAPRCPCWRVIGMYHEIRGAVAGLRAA
jgi:hypothetical protein